MGYLTERQIVAHVLDMTRFYKERPIDSEAHKKLMAMDPRDIWKKYKPFKEESNG